VDAQVPPVDAPLCGNGVVDRSNDEMCDDGSRNGAPDGQCTRQCFERYTLPYWPSHSTELPGHAIHETVDVELNGRHHVVIRDDNSVFLALRPTGSKETLVG
jgi:hypothetical protein